ncbi:MULTISPECIES: hypothetical protein [unclassified Microcoleus]|uniref:hypothetical protein n=1 Tax=unclassified Microcoleus TaxID=2642155 RepID=UPI002FD2DF11
MIGKWKSTLEFKESFKGMCDRPWHQYNFRFEILDLRFFLISMVYATHPARWRLARNPVSTSFAERNDKYRKKPGF